MTGWCWRILFSGSGSYFDSEYTFTQLKEERWRSSQQGTSRDNNDLGEMEEDGLMTLRTLVVDRISWLHRECQVKRMILLSRLVLRV